MERALSEGFVVVLHTPEGGSSGVAYIDHEGRRCIALTAVPRSLMACHILLHEIAHHRNGHVGQYRGYSKWAEEYTAEAEALDMLAPHLDYDTFFGVRERAKDYLRGSVQRFLDLGFAAPGEVEVGVWLGCDIHKAYLND
jgi:hypothetical protein